MEYPTIFPTEVTAVKYIGPFLTYRFDSCQISGQQEGIVKKTKNLGKDPLRLWELVSEMENILSETGTGAEPERITATCHKDDLIIAVANVLSLPLSQAARILLISSLLRTTGGDLCCRFNELAELSGLSERTAYRALKEIKQSGLFVIVATPGVGVQISAGWLWSDLTEGARKILEEEKIGFKLA